MIRPIRVLLDANVLVDAQVRDLFLRMADAGVVDVRWSADILDETRRALEIDLRLGHIRANRLIDTARRAFPDAEVTHYAGLIDSLTLPDAGDRHVLAAALVGECDVVVTENVRDFPADVLDRYDLAALRVDDSLTQLIDDHGSAVVTVVHELVATLRKPSMDLHAFLRRLSRIAPNAAMGIGTLVGDEDFTRLANDAADVVGPDGPHAAVRQLLDWVLDDEGAPPPILSAFLETLTGTTNPSMDELQDRFRVHLADVCASPDSWGFASARHPQSPGVETVVLLRAGGQARIAFEPQSHRGHAFDMEHTDAGWTLIAIDES